MYGRCSTAVAASKGGSLRIFLHTRTKFPFQASKVISRQALTVVPLKIISKLFCLPFVIYCVHIAHLTFGNKVHILC